MKKLAETTNKPNGVDISYCPHCGSGGTHNMITEGALSYTKCIACGSRWLRLSQINSDE